MYVRHSRMCGRLSILFVLLLMYLYAVLQYSSIWSSGSEDHYLNQRAKNPREEKEEVTLDLTYGRLYNEVTIHLAHDNRFSIYMGIKPALKNRFTREMRICDSFTDESISVTMFQLVRMLTNFKSLVWPKEKFEAYRNSDERYSFTIAETLAPKVETMSIAADGQPIRYKFNILGHRDKFILFHKPSLETLLDSEKEIIRVYTALNPEAVEEEYRKFLRECGDVTNIKSMSKNDARILIGNKAFEASAYEINAFSTETILKFWDFFYFNLTLNS